uniref:Zinc finger protein squeeze n=1 Tax=Phallusia mammillata TaxID=59560 RepID=A0A6F9DWV1_9ASCI|nr:zinc finger protein squeeze [Phallusia mammillata]
MDSSDNYFWNTTEVSNGGETAMVPSSMDSFIQQQQQGQILSQTQTNNSPKQSSLVQTSVASPQHIFVSQSGVVAGGSDKPKQEPTNAADGMLPVDLVNPDAIEPKPRSYTCRICQVTFPNKSAVTVHSRLHTDHQGKPYRCNFCSKGFSTNFYLKQHERIHSGQKPYKCPMCDNSFKQLSHVQQHVRTHTGVRPYKCHWPGCGKAFLQQSHLKSHEARHTPKPNTGVRPYKCHWPECGKSFAQLSNLKSHVARHTPGKNKRKSSANNTTVKKQETPSEEDGAFNFQNVINQAAAAANIVPTAVDEEAEIRPYLCPGCSKLYVREATFKKHLEECKTKLQMSISATATALGIDPPPIPSSSAVLNEYDPSLLQLGSAQGQEEPAKRRRMDTKMEEVTIENNAQQQQQHIETQEVTVSSEVSSNIHVKEEPVSMANDTANFVSRQAISQESEYKVPQIVADNNQHSIYTVQSTSQHHIPVNNVIFQIGDQKQQQQMMTVGQTGNIQQQNIILTSTDSQQDNVQLVDALSQAPTILLTQPVTSSSGVTKENEQDHSTINQAAIRWQWDQPVPRLNFP